MEKTTENSQTDKKEDKKFERKLLKFKTVNWRNHHFGDIKKIAEENKKAAEESKSLGKKSTCKKAQNQISLKSIVPDNTSVFIEIEVIDKDGNACKKLVKGESEEKSEFLKKRRKSNHDEYAKCREYLKTHPDGDEDDED